MTQCCIITTGLSVLRSAAMAERPVLDCFSRYIKKKKTERRRRGGGDERNNHWEKDVLSTGAPANCLAHKVVGCISRLLDVDPALPPQGCWHLGSTDDSSVWHQLFFLFFFNHQLPTIRKSVFSPRGFPAPYQKWPSCDGLASSECQTALWYFNEAMELRKLPPASW